MKTGLTVDVNVRPMLDEYEIDLDDLKRALGHGKPCDWCDGKGIVQWHEGCYTVSYTNYERYLIVHYCPNCGRKLEGKDARD